MSVVFFGNNRVGVEVLRYLLDIEENVVAVVLHPEDRIQCGDELRALAHRSGAELLVSGTELRDPAVREALAQLCPRVGVSAFFGYVLQAPVLELFSVGCINVHPSLLPVNFKECPGIWRKSSRPEDVY